MSEYPFVTDVFRNEVYSRGEAQYARLRPQLEPAFNRTLDPLVEQLTKGVKEGRFRRIDPLEDAKSIHHVVSGVVEQRWAGFPLRYREARGRTVRFCLAALGVDAPTIEATLDRDPAHPLETASSDGPPPI